MKTNGLTKEEILVVLRKNKNFFKTKFDIENIILFGSYARGEATPASDIDILIESDKQSFRKKFYLQEFLQEQFQKKVDVIYIDAVNPFFMRFIKDEMVYA